MLTFRVLIFLTIATASIAGTLRGAVGRRGGAPNSQLDGQEPTATEQAAYASVREGLPNSFLMNRVGGCPHYCFSY